MKISKKDARLWFSFFAALPEGETLTVRQQEIALAVFAQLERAAEARREPLRRQIPDLRTLEGRTEYVGPAEKFPRGCRSCLLGTGLSAVRRTNRCNLRCPFCYDYGQTDCQPPVGEDLWEIGGTRMRAEDVPLALRIQGAPTGVAYVYLEPFLEIELYYPVIRAFHEAGVVQHLYTNGTLATPENLRLLGEAGLDELRFNLGATDCAPRVVEHMAEAKRFIPSVGIETPMTPAFYAQITERSGEILGAGIDFINCAELHLNPNNLCNYEGESLYFHRMGYLSPMWSRELTLKLMARASRERWDVVVHDCSNATKFARDLNHRAKEGAWFGASSYGCEFPEIPYAAFLPALEDEDVAFAEEEELPEGYRVGDIVI